MSTRFWKWTSIALFIVAAIEGLLLLQMRGSPTAQKVPPRDDAQTMLKLLQPNDDPTSGDALSEDDFGLPMTNHAGGLIGPERQDKGSEIWLEFQVQGGDNVDIQVKIDEGHLLLTSQSKKGDQNSNVQMEFSHSQLFPLPRDADPMGFKIKRETGKFIVIFKKLAHPNPAVDDTEIDI